MNFFRKIIAALYPLQMRISKITGMGIRIYENKNRVAPKENFYSLKYVLNNGKEISFEEFKNRKVLLVNLASECGFTPQYHELQQLALTHKNLIVLGFPSNNFAGQEPGSDEAIAGFCERNYGVTFRIFKKGDVTGPSKQPVYQWLTDADKNGWNNRGPGWNFYKYLVDEHGTLSAVYSSSVSPADIPVN